MGKAALFTGGLLWMLAVFCRAEEQLPLVKTGEHYLLRARASAAGAGRGKLQLEIAVTDGWKLNRKAPLLVKVSPGEGWQMEKTSWSAKDAARLEDRLCRFEIPYQASSAAVLRLEFNFVICNDMLCQKKKFSLDYRPGEKEGDSRRAP